MIRLFAALAVPSDVGERLARLQSGLRGARWRPAATLHVTLAFYGEVREDTARDLDAALAVLAGGPVGVALAGVGSFGETHDPHAVWAAVEANPGLERLAAGCAAAARRTGLRLDSRAWRPHVTLAYLRRAGATGVAAWIQANIMFREPAFALDRFGLYSSWRTEAGSMYRLEAEYLL